MKKILVEITKSKFGNETLEKWSRVSVFRRIRKWAREHELGLWSSAVVVLVFVVVMLGYMIYEIRSL